MKFILAKKVGMTRIFGEDGRALAGTILTAGPVRVTQVKSKDADGYSAVQVGYGTRKASRVGKAVLGHTKGMGYEAIREFRIQDAGTLSVGADMNAGVFSVGDMVIVSGFSKGHGFAGVVKRHGFHGGPRSHGQKHSEREGGSIGGSGGRAGGRVAKGIGMPGRMGHERVTVKNLKVLAVDSANNEMIVSGAVPGTRGTLLEIVSAPTGTQAE
ncbi:MAG: 50S ribosomal protein L3 [bacterium]|nr:50S ribosomal protein L3 [bacterium]